jgi:hypothetical protein
MGLQVIGAGFGRTGTLSFKLAVEQLGFDPCHHMMEVMSSEPDVEAWTRAAEGTLTDWDDLYGGWAATCDFPHCVFYAELAEFYPEAKVVLTVRDAESWYRSASATIFSPDNLKRFNGRGDGDDSGGAMRSALADVIGRVVDMRSELGSDEMIRAFERHNAEVRATIPPERLLVFEASQGWEPLCEFLEVPVPDTAYPRTNTSEEFRNRMSQRPRE